MFGYKNLCCNFWRKRNSTINTKKKNIFEETQGLTEERMNRYYKKWMCSECKYTSDTFMEFIPKKFSNDFNVVTVKNMNQEPETIPGRELLNNYNIPSSEIFSQNLNLKNNRNSKSNKTIAENNLKNGNHIMIHEIDS